MPKKKPCCADYIVEAIRQTRPVRKGLKPDTFSGRALRFIFAFAKQFYSERVFRQSLNSLLETGIVVIVAQTVEIQRSLGENDKHNSRLQKISRIPTNAPLEKSRWFFNKQGKFVDFEKREHCRYMKNLVLYVVADGLPGTVAKAVSGNGTTKAEQIMASLQQKK